ncbi:MAG: D-glycero-alpha-D-manno-heptose-1,7-bisphosphate 7-phosphatase [Thermoflexibacter sp.]
MPNLSIYPSWTLFLDRDGVINVRLVDNYVKTWEEFEFMPNAQLSIAQLRTVFKYIFVVTNQQGIGKGLMNEIELANIHQNMLAELAEHNPTSFPIIDKIYYCPSLKSNNDICRKPDIGMALQAQKEFPDVDFQKSLMIGDSISDMEFGKNAGMFTIFFGESPVSQEDEGKIDFRCRNWEEVIALLMP